MPTICMFQGIIIKMYLGLKDHPPPHFHAWYQGMEATFSIHEGVILEGSFPDPKRRLVEAWIELRREELLADWELARADQPLEKIDPLR